MFPKICFGLSTIFEGKNFISVFYYFTAGPKWSLFEWITYGASLTDKVVATVFWEHSKDKIAKKALCIQLFLSKQLISGT